MVFEKKDIVALKMAMINKYGKTSYKALSEELGVSRTALSKAINNDGSFDKLKERLIMWTKDNI